MEKDENRLEKACELMEEFSFRTGLTGKGGDHRRRYLWTDALAVMTLFGLWEKRGEESFKNRALDLIDIVHEVLGRHRIDDSREGWISGLSEEEGRKRPTVGGLRIGKDRPEREAGEGEDERLEWERDGQYFHYNTRWIRALLQAAEITGQERFSTWAADLLKASLEGFMDTSGGEVEMYWKMSIDLSRPQVSRMGGHDPLDGYLTTETIRHFYTDEEEKEDWLAYLKDLEKLCQGRSWATYDPLGIGGLLLNALRASQLFAEVDLPPHIRPQKLLEDSRAGLKAYEHIPDLKSPADQRLAFRECGLSLGLRILKYMDGQSELASYLQDLEPYLPLATKIEKFWLNPSSQKAASWTEHLDINEVSLAASLVPGGVICQ